MTILDRNWSPLLLAACLAACLAAGACSSGSDNSTPGPSLVQYTQVGSCAVPAPPNRFTFALGTVDNAAKTFELVVSATLGDTVRGAAFHVSFNPAVLEFVKFEADPAFQGLGLAQAGLLDGAPGRVAVGVSRLGSEPGVTGAVVLGTLTLHRRVDAGSSAVGFSDELLADAATSFTSELPSCWLNGQLDITPQ